MSSSRRQTRAFVVTLRIHVGPRSYPRSPAGFGKRRLTSAWCYCPLDAFSPCQALASSSAPAHTLKRCAPFETFRDSATCRVSIWCGSSMTGAFRSARPTPKTEGPDTIARRLRRQRALPVHRPRHAPAGRGAWDVSGLLVRRDPRRGHPQPDRYRPDERGAGRSPHGRDAQRLPRGVRARSRGAHCVDAER